MSRGAVSKSCVRQMLSEAAGGARVSEEAVYAAVGELDALLAAIIERVAEQHERECRAREAQGLHRRPDVRADHVLGEAVLSEGFAKVASGLERMPGGCGGVPPSGGAL